MSTKIYAIENADGHCLAVGYESHRDARQDARESTSGGRARSFDSVGELRAHYADDDWLDRYSDEELAELPGEMDEPDV